MDPATRRYWSALGVLSFVGFAPADDPRLAMIVLLDEPKNEKWGSEAAAPIFAAIGREALRYLNVAPRDSSPVPIVRGELARVTPERPRAGVAAEGPALDAVAVPAGAADAVPAPAPAPAAQIDAAMPRRVGLAEGHDGRGLRGDPRLQAGRPALRRRRARPRRRGGGGRGRGSPAGQRGGPGPGALLARSPGAARGRLPRASVAAPHRDRHHPHPPPDHPGPARLGAPPRGRAPHPPT